MAATAPGKHHPPRNNEWLKVILQKKSVWSKNECSVATPLFRLNDHYFKKWTTPGVVLKKYILILQKLDASNRSSLTLAVSKNYSFPTKN